MAAPVALHYLPPMPARLSLPLLLAACGVSQEPDRHRPDVPDDPPVADTAPPEETAAPARCPQDTVDLGTVCMDRHEAPGQPGALPFVMFSFLEAQSWCDARGRRLCWDDEWEGACAGASGTAYPYGDTRQPGVCNDEETWLTYDQSLLNLWPWSLETDSLESLDQLLEAATAAGGASAAAHVRDLYQGEGSGQNPGCTNETGVMDLVGNVEEWTLRRDGGSADFHGNLKGRYWADTRTCQDDITAHGDSFRFYEIGFRCCVDPAP